MQTSLFDETEFCEGEAVHTCMTLAERIESERIAKQPSQPFAVKQLAKMKLRFDLVIQRNMRWTDAQGTSLIESSLLGYPVPPVYALKSNDKSIWLLDGKQRLGKYISFLNDEWKLTECVAYGVDITGLYFSQLPKEFQELVEMQMINIYQFENLTSEQRDQLFKRLNSGTPLSKIELIRSILGTDLLNYINGLIDTPFIKKVGITPKQQDTFKDQELILQMIAIITGRQMDLSGNALRDIALSLRTKGLTEDELSLIDKTFKYLSDAFDNVDNKVAKNVLKKANIVGIAGVAVDSKDRPEVFGDVLSAFIYNQKSGSRYKATTASGSAKRDKVLERITILKGVLKMGQDTVRIA